MNDKADRCLNAKKEISMEKLATHQSISSILQNVIDNHHFSHELSIDELTAIFKYRSFSILILIFAVFSVIPTAIIPGVSAVVGLPITLLGLQLGIGMDHPWIPKSIAKKKIKKATIQKIFTKIKPKIVMIEKLLKPRWALFSAKFFLCLIGWSFVTLGILLMLPLPFTNMLFGLFILLLSIGLMEKDGIVLLFGLTITFLLIASVIITVVSIIKL